MATNIPPHNLREVINACLALIENPDLSVTELFKYVPGPDFPTAGIINGSRGIREAYCTGRGRIYVRARTHIETDKDGNPGALVVTALPSAVLVLIGERPGLSSPDSLGAYITWAPGAATSDADRNCVSNIRPQGLAPQAAAAKIAWLLNQMRVQQRSGLALKDQMSQPVQVPAG